MMRPDDADDQRLVQRIVVGDEQGITELLETYGGRVAGYLNKRFPSLDDHEIHDALVDAVIAVGRSFDPRRGSLPAWFLFLAHQAAVDRLRGNRRPSPVEPLSHHAERAVSMEQPVDDVLRRERGEAVRAALEGLSDLERAVIEADLEVDGSANARGLARQLGTTAESVYAARTRARRKLARRLVRVVETLPDPHA